LGQPAGEPKLLLLARNIRGEAHARFLIQQLRMLAQHLPVDDPLVELVVFEASMGGRTRSGALWITLPVDYLHWTESVHLMALSDDVPPSRVFVAGEVSKRVRTELVAAGWQIEAKVGLSE
jgi:hypothetical protein